MRDLIDLSRKYGSDPELVLAGGGNTSMKEDGVLYVKSSGCALASIDREGFVALRLPELLDILKKDYPASDKEREAAYLADVFATRLPGEEEKRPSVEALLHGLFPQRYVLHLHPALVNGLTCAVNGEDEAGRLFPNAVWVPACRPGYTLGKLLSESMEEGTDTVLLQNHGVFFAADSAKELDTMLDDMLRAISSKIGMIDELPEVSLGIPFTPDHIVYCGVGPLLPDNENARLLYNDAKKIAAFSEFFGGPLPLKNELVDFILNWEAESYRKSQS